MLSVIPYRGICKESSFFLPDLSILQIFFWIFTCGDRGLLV